MDRHRKKEDGEKKKVIDFVFIENRNNHNIKHMIIDKEGNSKIESHHNLIQFKWEIEKRDAKKTSKYKDTDLQRKIKIWRRSRELG